MIYDGCITGTFCIVCHSKNIVMDGRTDKTSISYIRLSLFHFRLQRSGSHILPCMSTAIVSRVSLDSK